MSAARLYRLTGIAGVLTGILIAFNATRRTGLIPTNTLTHALSTPATALALITLTGLYLWQRERGGPFGLVAYAVNFIGLAGVFAIEFATHTILPYLDPTVRDELLAGPTKRYFLVVAIVFLIGVVLFGIASWRARVFPAPAIALYVIGLVPAALRTAVPSAVYDAGLIVGAAGTIWLSLALLRPLPTRPGPARPAAVEVHGS